MLRTLPVRVQTFQQTAGDGASAYACTRPQTGLLSDTDDFEEHRRTQP